MKTEHDILAQLSQQSLSFKVPAAKPTLQSNEPYVVLSNGAAACVFEIIPGTSVGGDVCAVGLDAVEAAAVVVRTKQSSHKYNDER